MGLANSSTPISPAIAPIHNALHEAQARGLPRNPAREAELARVMEQSQRTYAEMRRRAIPVVIGGDYGFVSTPQGVMADHEARERNVGGEVLCKVF